MRKFLGRVDVLAWDSICVERDGAVQAHLEERGKKLASLDVLIATHTLSVGALMVTSDKAFGQVANLPPEDWTQQVVLMATHAAGRTGPSRMEFTSIQRCLKEPHG